ncbi:hypothetical protein [Saccharothrix yanglingensis]|uniref:hypothetical protein n=1 Tax=Saccharothrix yanglingensis TaxID=659496 RepID=UPI0027D30DDB|nr:hypothetical protein [Saccharothrix yanglingensis]
MIRNLVVRSVLPVAVLGAVLAGCTSTPGTPTPETTGAATATTGGATSPTTSGAAAGDGLADFDVCAELEGVASALGLTEIERKGAQDCEARYAGRIGVRVKAQPELGVEEFVPGSDSKISDLPLGGHRAKLVTAPLTTSSCAVTIEVTPSSRVDVVSSSPATQEQACEAATKVATAVEPKLPK